MPLINCEITLFLSWCKECVLVGRAFRGPPAAAANRINSPTSAKFEITDCKLYVPIVTLSAQNDNKLLEQLKSGFRRSIKWNKYMSQMSNQNKNNNLNYLTIPHLVMLTDYLSYLLKTKMTELLFINITCKV